MYVGDAPTGATNNWSINAGAINHRTKSTWDNTIIAAGTTGAQTINNSSGQVNFAAAASTLVVTNSLVTTSSQIFVQLYGTDATAKSARVTKASGSFTIILDAPDPQKQP